jgi:hypothetical protein
VAEAGTGAVPWAWHIGRPVRALTGTAAYTVASTVLRIAPPGVLATLTERGRSGRGELEQLAGVRPHLTVDEQEHPMSSPQPRNAPPPTRFLRHPVEVPFFIVMVVLNVLIVAAILQAAVVLPFLPAELHGTSVAIGIRTALVGLLLFVPALIVIRETQRAAVRGSAVELSQRQFPDIHRTADGFAAELGLRRRPQIFLTNGNGALNAFAAQATGHDYVVLSNELFANLYNDNRDGLRFILGHEMGHIRLHHVSLWYQIAVAYPQRIPLLGPALSRLREYSCDRHGGTCPRTARPAWSCSHPGDTRRTRSTSTSSCGRAGSCAASGSVSRNCLARTRSPSVVSNG